ncbi:uncharacterized protein N7482_000763 [Penicillium canariense]|uniref:SP-RING-type domain-containing protein n=1 Tax=Penicillium canariense TaxID=189055 RepID=A0A9W9IFZ8_9EURO|nr:uncharacterized protein N7482_000763 [Penicillium canariense]KAJ5174886.1 hypothetical protein N7482_000763 [Penicillium canariense]
MTSRFQRPRPADQVEESNSTASLFLGGVRRNWMAAPALSPTVPTPSLCPPRDARPVAMAPPDPVTGTDSRISLDAPNRVNPNGSDCPPAELALLSPVTPGVNLQPASLDPPVDSEPGPPQTACPPSVPKAGSHPSPIVSPRPTTSTNELSVAAVAAPPAPDRPTAMGAVTAHLRSDGTATLRQPLNPPSPSSMSTQAPTGSPSGNTETPISASSGHRSAGPGPRSLQFTTGGIHAQSVQSPSLQVPSQTSQSPVGPSTSPADAPESHAPEPPPQQVIPTPPGSQDFNRPTSQDWIQWKHRSEALMNQARLCSRHLALPRAMLLTEACDHQDLFFLVLHQIFCELSRGYHRVLSRIPPLRQPLSQIGLERLEELLEPNANLPPVMLTAFCFFPRSVEDYIRTPWYQAIIEEFSRCLACLATRVSSLQTNMHRQLRSRGYPPLVAELKQEYDVKSPVLLSVIFSSICRHLYKDEHLESLRRIFQNDWLLTTGPGLDQSALAALIEQYRTIPMIFMQTAGPPRPQPSTASFAPPANGNRHSASNSPHLQSPTFSPTMSSGPRDRPLMTPAQGQLTHYQYPSEQIAQLNGQVPTRAWQMDQVAQAHMLQGQGQPVQPVQLQSVHQAQEQGQQAWMRPVLMVPQNQTAPLGYPVPTRVNSSSSSPPHSALGRPSQVSQRQDHQQQQQNPLPPWPSLTRSPAENRASQGLVQSQRSQSREQQVLSAQSASLPAVQVPQTQNSPSPSCSVPLLPPAGHRAPQVLQPNPMRIGLHQADLRDPVKLLLHRGLGGEMMQTELYQYLDGFLLNPTVIDLDTFKYTWDFLVSTRDRQCFPQYVDRGQGQRPARMYEPGCRTYRLRAIALPSSQKESAQRVWPTANTTWPSVFYVFVNGTELYVRRKVHNGKDLPLDITKYLHEGENKLTIHLLLGPDECKNFHYAFGIEIMEVSQLEQVLAKTRHASPSETRANIKDRLNPTTDDDELAIITDSLTVGLIDPFMAQIFNIPARSTNCTHIECFDLDTFINTRKSESGPGPMNDNWCCPICNADARPQSLIVDHFFVEVRDKLMMHGKLECTRAIQIRADGTWEAKITSDDASSSPSRSRFSNPPPSKKRTADIMADGAEELPRTKQEPSSVVHVREAMVIEIDE